MLDVCTAYVGRDEVRDMEQFLVRAITQTTLPLMIDSTEVNVIERALQLAPGKCVVNSINFEDGEGKARRSWISVVTSARQWWPSPSMKQHGQDPRPESRRGETAS